jgi:hypothetical protein
MKAWTLFFVILFSNIYGQRHISIRYFTGNGFLQNNAKSIVKDYHDFTWTFTEAVQKRITPFVNAAENGALYVHAFNNNQKLTTITIGTKWEHLLQISQRMTVETTLIKAKLYE